MSIHDFIIEGDSLIISKALSDLSPLLLRLPQLFMGCSSMHNFSRVHSSHVRRQGNRFTHLLAKHT